MSLGGHPFLSVIFVRANPEYKSDYLVKINFRSNLLGFHIVEFPGCWVCPSVIRLLFEVLSIIIDLLCKALNWCDM